MIGSRWLTQLNIHLSRVQINFYQTMMAPLLVPPPSVRGQNKVDYEAFKILLKNIPSLVVSNLNLPEIIKNIQPFLLKLPFFKPVQLLETEEKQFIIHLDPRKINNISDSLKKEILWNKIYKEVDIKLSYNNWPSYEVLYAILPEGIEIPTSFSQIGHIVHFNLRSEQLPYKHVIGQVYLDKIPTAKTVVNKINIIDNVYRNFKMEILAGESNTIVSVKEFGCVYHFDFAKVYWNPKLSTEHFTLVNFMKAGDVLYDVFAGVGPFVVPSARKGVRVLANDLNPDSHTWLIKNVQINKVSNLVTTFNKDGRDFLREDVKKDILARREKNSDGFEHISMNLPALAVDFLDIFSNWFGKEDVDKVCLKPPKVHVYCFIKADKDKDLKALAKELVEEKIGAEISPESLINIHLVRNVSTNKIMMRVSFSLRKEMLKSEEPAMKKLKIANDNNHNFPGSNGEE